MQNRIRTVFTAVAVITFAACSDGVRPLVSPDIDEVARSNSRKHTSFAVEGRARVDVRRLGVGGPLGLSLQSVVGEYRAYIDANGASGGAVNFANGRLDLIAIAAHDRSRGRGSQERTMVSRRGRDERVVTRSSRADAPPDEMEIWTGNIVSGRIAKVWVPLDGAWRLAEYTFTMYEGGRPATSITVTLDAPERVDYEVSSESDAKRPGGLTRSVAPPDRASYYEDAVCETELASLDEAMALYGVASASMISCLAGPWQCLAAFLAVAGAAARLDSAAERLEICLKKAV